LGRWLLGERRNGWRVQLVPWSGMFIGAIIGAALAHLDSRPYHLGLRALFVSGLLAGVVALLSLSIPRRWQLGYMPR
jgi:uncharacterized membrane protein YoaK (UPF0700 family)